MSLFSLFSWQKRLTRAPLELPVPLWRRNSAGVISEANAAYRALLGLSAEETLKELVPATARKERIHRVVEGQRRLFEVIETGEGGIAVDITAQEELTDQREDLNQALTQVMEHSASAMAVFDGARRLTRYNQAFLSLWGLKEAQLKNTPRYEELLEQWREQRRLPEQANFAQFRKEQMAYFTDLTEPYYEFFYLPDGTSLKVVVIPYATRGLIFIYENMTDQLALERKFNETLAVMKAAFNNLYEGIAVFGEDGRLKLSNPRYAEIWQLDWELIEAKPKFAELLEANEYLYDTAMDWPSRMQSMLAPFHARKRETRLLELIDGRVIQWSVIPLPDGGTLMTYLDISDSERVERSLRERNQALEEAGSIKTKFLANVSYDLRSPLTSIRGFSEFLLEEAFGPLNDKQREYMHDILRAAQDLSVRIDEVLDIASLEAGYTTLDVSEFDIYMMLSSIFPFVQEKLQRQQLKLDFDCPPTIGRMMGDERRLRHALLSVLDQFLKFCPKESHIRLKVWEDEGTIRLLLEDEKLTAELLQTTGQESGQTLVATDTLEAIGSPVILSLLKMHGGTLRTQHPDGQHFRVLMHMARRYEGFTGRQGNVQLSSAL